MRQQCLQGGGVQRRDFQTGAFAGQDREVPEQLQDVLGMLAQWRQIQRDHVQAVVEVFAKLAGAGRFAQIPLGGGDDADIDGAWRIAAEPLDAALLQHPQQLDLQRHRHRFDLIEKQGAAVGVFQLADAALAGTGEGTFLMAEQFRLDQRLRHAATIERHEGLAGASAALVQTAGDTVLAGAGFAIQQGVGIDRRQA